jgi:hypothetical protein
MEPRATINEHYVPKAYLDAFTNLDGQISVFDKVTRRLFLTNPRNVASERKFNDFPQTLDSSNPALYQFVEKGLAGIESKGIPLLRKTVENALSIEIPTLRSPRILSSKDRTNLAALTALQLARTRKDRELAQKIFSEVGLELLKEAKNDHDREVSAQNLDRTYNEDYIKRQHLEFLFDAASKFAAILESKLIYLAVNRTAVPFWTSDYPVVRDSHQGRSSLPVDGLSSPKVKIVYPLSPQVAMIFLDPIWYSHWEGWNGKVKAISKQEVNHFNELQVKQSYRFVFSSSDRMQRAQMVCSENGLG